jgi:hypothetical protein
MDKKIIKMTVEILCNGIIEANFNLQNVVLKSISDGLFINERDINKANNSADWMLDLLQKKPPNSIPTDEEKLENYICYWIAQAKQHRCSELIDHGYPDREPLYKEFDWAGKVMKKISAKYPDVTKSWDCHFQVVSGG